MDKVRRYLQSKQSKEILPAEKHSKSLTLGDYKDSLQVPRFQVHSLKDIPPAIKPGFLFFYFYFLSLYFYLLIEVEESFTVISCCIESSRSRGLQGKAPLNLAL